MATAAADRAFGWALVVPGLGDEHLARLAAQGNQRALSSIYERYQLQLLRYCRSILREDDAAQDAVQSTFLRAFAALNERRLSAPLRPWLFRIAHNESVSLLRRRQREQQVEKPARLHAVSAEEQAGERERLTRLFDDLGQLPVRLRSALLLRELCGLSHDEIAYALGSSESAAKQAVFASRRALLDLQEGRAMACETICRRISDGDGRTLRARRVSAHLRECPSCAAFAAQMRSRRAELEAVLAPALGGGLLAGLGLRLRARFRGAFRRSASGGSSASSGAGSALSGAAKAVMAVAGPKALAGAAVIATAAAGVGALGQHGSQPARVAAASVTGAPFVASGLPAAAAVRRGLVDARATSAPSSHSARQSPAAHGRAARGTPPGAAHRGGSAGHGEANHGLGGTQGAVQGKAHVHASGQGLPRSGSRASSGRLRDHANESQNSAATTHSDAGGGNKATAKSLVKPGK